MIFHGPALVAVILAFQSNSLAQTRDQPIPADRAIPVSIAQIHGGGYDRSFGPRVDLEVYQIGTPTETGGNFAASAANVYDDANFAGPYQSNSSPLRLNGMSIGFIMPAVYPPANGDHLYTRVSFYPSHDNTVPGTSVPYSGSPVVAQLDWGSGFTSMAPAGGVMYYPSSITFAGPPFAVLSNTNVFNGGPDDRTAGVKIELYNDAAYTVRALDFGVARRSGFALWRVGSSDTFSWYANTMNGEIPNADRTGGGALATTIVPGGNSGNCRATSMGFQGTGFDIGFHGCGEGDLGCPTSLSVPCDVSDNDVRWVRFCLTIDATDEVGRFFDLDCEGSLPDVALAIYDGTDGSPGYGNLIALDTDSGSGTQPMLSFGIGRRGAVGDGRQYDGRNHYGLARGLPAGVYYAAIAPNNSTFADEFHVTGVGPGGNIRINIQSNLDGAPLAPSVRPDPDVNLGRVLGDTPIPQGTVAPSDVRWVHFQTCLGASPTRPVSIDLTSTTAADSSLTLFDSAGNLVAQAVATGSPPASLMFSSPTSLPAGGYDLAISRADIQLAPDSRLAGRWHIRSVSGTNPDMFQGVVHVGWATCCGTGDFNGDGDLGTDSDIASFFACLAGNCCPACGTADFDGDGDTGTDGDIESFFRVLGGGRC